jgi:crossover junction endodeoxyribonuclease RusA
MQHSQVFTLPYPPSVNKHLKPIRYYDAKKEKFVKRQKNTEIWNAYLQNAAKELMMQKRKRIDPNIELKVFIEAYPPDNRIRDTDNIVKIILDSLTRGGVYDDDRQVWEHTVRRKKEKLNCVKVYISPLENT